MLIIPGFLISIITFPGVIVHEAAHQLFCRLFRLPVFEVCYFRMKRPIGYVIHEHTDNPTVNFFISIGPFLVNTILGAAIALPASIHVLTLGSGLTNPLDILNLWLGISLLMHAFPSTGDAKTLYETVVKNPNVNTAAKVLVMPVIGLIYIGAYGSIVWLDLGYAVGVCLLLPQLLMLFV